MGAQSTSAVAMEVLEVIQWHPEGITNLELSNEIKLPINSVVPRVFELRRKGFVIEKCRRICAVTGRMSIAWVATRKEQQLTFI